MAYSADRVAGAVALLAALTSPLAAQQREPATIPTVLAKSMISPFFGELGTPHFVVGQLPSGWKATLDAGAAAKVVGGVSIGSFRSVIYRFPSADAVSEYRQRLRRSGFSPAGVERPRGGFTSAEPPEGAQLCGADGIVTVSQVDSSATSRSVRVTLLSVPAAIAMCGRGADRADGRSAPLDIPPLTAPVGVATQAKGSGWGNDNMYTSAQVDTTLSAVAVLDHYIGQLTRAGWTAGARLADATTGVQPITVRDRNGKAWTGALTVITIGAHRSVTLSMWQTTSD